MDDDMDLDKLWDDLSLGSVDVPPPPALVPAGPSPAQEAAAQVPPPPPLVAQAPLLTMPPSATAATASTSSAPSPTQRPSSGAPPLVPSPALSSLPRAATSASAPALESPGTSAPVLGSTTSTTIPPRARPSAAPPLQPAVSSSARTTTGSSAPAPPLASSTQVGAGFDPRPPTPEQPTTAPVGVVKQPARSGTFPPAGTPLLPSAPALQRSSSGASPAVGAPALQPAVPLPPKQTATAPPAAPALQRSSSGAGPAAGAGAPALQQTVPSQQTTTAPPAAPALQRSSEVPKQEPVGGAPALRATVPPKKTSTITPQPVMPPAPALQKVSPPQQPMTSFSPSSRVPTVGEGLPGSAIAHPLVPGLKEGPVGMPPSTGPPAPSNLFGSSSPPLSKTAPPLPGSRGGPMLFKDSSTPPPSLVPVGTVPLVGTRNTTSPFIPGSCPSTSNSNTSYNNASPYLAREEDPLAHQPRGIARTSSGSSTPIMMEMEPNVTKGMKSSGSSQPFSPASSMNASAGAVDSTSSELQAPVPLTDWDLELRENLSKFYKDWQPPGKTDDQLDLIVRKFRRKTPELWAQVCMKYKVKPLHGVSLLAKSLHPEFPYELMHEEDAMTMEEKLKEYEGRDRAFLFQHFLLEDPPSMRLLSHRGVPDTLRKSIWGQLLELADSYTNAQLYEQYKKELLPLTTPEFQMLWDEVLRDTLRTQPEVTFFTKEKKDVLQRILYLYARLNPGIRYVQGMNEIAAPLLYVFEDESETFWAFASLMGQIKDYFMQDLDDDSVSGVYAELNRLDHIVRTYDPELSDHFAAAELSPTIYGLRWVTTWLAQDTHLLDCIRLWDMFLSSREMVLFSCAAVLFILREKLLKCTEFGDLITMVQDAPKGVLSRDLDQVLVYAYSLLAFKKRNQRIVDSGNESLKLFPSSAAHGVSSGEVLQLLQHDLKQAKEAVVLLAESDDVQQALEWSAGALVNAKETTVGYTKEWLEDTKDQRAEAMRKLGNLWGNVRSAAKTAAASDTAKEASSWFSSIIRTQNPGTPSEAPERGRQYVVVEDNDNTDWE